MYVKKITNILGVLERLSKVEKNQENYITREEIKILITHIGGFPKKYKKHIEDEIKKYKPDLYICGHSHILKIIHDSYKDSHNYFHYVKALSDLSFSNIFHTEYSNDSLKLIPIGSVFLHSFFYKIFGFFGFIFLELFSIFVFLIIFF